MNKQTKTIIGLAVLAGVGYYAYTKLKNKSSLSQGKCPAGQVEIQVQCKQAPCPTVCEAI